MQQSPETFLRSTRTVLTAHAEAFQVMLYRSDDGEEAWFWNSRDGVTPFGTVIDGKMYRHAMGDYVPSYMGALPDKAQYVWVTYTPETWRALHTAKFETMSQLEDEYGEHFRAQFPNLEVWLSAVPFEHGQPHQLTREKFLATTPEWMGKA
ncbi:hypothetical protein [Novosphingobium sp. KN65.2]|uniref:hypothetical protein n=1 Tax=Novosphingobium sp. KN65.2 TaxID=1478134 RepID=UPI0005E6F30D|nr:hypothetical protein [Novosphingobium sp. KN65.2]CDO37627.1 hypothetical protein SPHV1_370014 [Novosphingobium sp. KN65.2]